MYIYIYVYIQTYIYIYTYMFRHMLIINNSTTKSLEYHRAASQPNVKNRQRKRHDSYKQIGRLASTVAVAPLVTTVAAAATTVAVG